MFTSAKMNYIGIDAVVMILRVSALYNRSRFILGILFTLYAVELILYLVDRVILNITQHAGMWSVVSYLSHMTKYLPSSRSYSGHH